MRRFSRSYCVCLHFENRGRSLGTSSFLLDHVRISMLILAPGAKRPAVRLRLFWHASMQLFKTFSRTWMETFPQRLVLTHSGFTIVGILIQIPNLDGAE
jgi:hypothetical protein